MKALKFEKCTKWKNTVEADLPFGEKVTVAFYKSTSKWVVHKDKKIIEQFDEFTSAIEFCNDTYNKECGHCGSTSPEHSSCPNCEI